jgi:hypothetical protein
MPDRFQITESAADGLATWYYVATLTLHRLVYLSRSCPSRQNDHPLITYPWIVELDGVPPPCPTASSPPIQRSAHVDMFLGV